MAVAQKAVFPSYRNDSIPVSEFLGPRAEAFASAIDAFYINAGRGRGLAEVSSVDVELIAIKVDGQEYKDRLNLIGERIRVHPDFKALDLDSPKKVRNYLVKLAGKEPLDNVTPEDLIGPEAAAIVKALHERLIEMGVKEGVLGLNTRDKFEVEFKAVNRSFLVTTGFLNTLARSGKIEGVGTFDEARTYMGTFIGAGLKLPPEELLGPDKEEIAKAIDDACRAAGVEDGVVGFQSKHSVTFKLTLNGKHFEDNVFTLFTRASHSEQFAALHLDNFSMVRRHVAQLLGRDVSPLIPTTKLLDENFVKGLAVVLDGLLMKDGVETGLAGAPATDNKIRLIKIGDETYKDSVSNIMNKYGLAHGDIGLHEAKCVLAGLAGRPVTPILPLELFLDERKCTEIAKQLEAWAVVGGKGGLAGIRQTDAKEVAINIDGKAYVTRPGALLGQRLPRFFSQQEGYQNIDTFTAVKARLSSLIGKRAEHRVPTSLFLNPADAKELAKTIHTECKKKLEGGIGGIVLGKDTWIDFEYKGIEYHERAEKVLVRIKRLKKIGDDDVSTFEAAKAWLTLQAGLTPYLVFPVELLLGQDGPNIAKKMDAALVSNGQKDGFAEATVECPIQIRFEHADKHYEGTVRSVFQRIARSPAFVSEGVDSLQKAKVFVSRAAGRETAIKIEVEMLLDKKLGPKLVKKIEKVCVDEFKSETGIAGITTVDRRPLSFELDGQDFTGPHMSSLLNRMCTSSAFMQLGVNDTLAAKAWLSEAAGRRFLRRIPMEFFLEEKRAEQTAKAIHGALLEAGLTDGVGRINSHFRKPLVVKLGEKDYEDTIGSIAFKIASHPEFVARGVDTPAKARNWLADRAGIRPKAIATTQKNRNHPPLPIDMLLDEEGTLKIVAGAFDKALESRNVGGIANARATDNFALVIKVGELSYEDSYSALGQRIIKSPRFLQRGIDSYLKVRAWMAGSLGKVATLPIPHEQLLDSASCAQLVKKIDNACVGFGGLAGITNSHDNRSITFGLGQYVYVGTINSLTQQMCDSEGFAKLSVDTQAKALKWLKAKCGEELYETVSAKELLDEKFAERFCRDLDSTYVTGLVSNKGIRGIAADDSKKVAFSSGGKRYKESMGAITQRISKLQEFNDLGVDTPAKARDWLAEKAENIRHLAVERFLDKGFLSEFSKALDSAYSAAGVEGGMASLTVSDRQRVVVEVRKERYLIYFSSLLQKMLFSQELKPAGMTSAADARRLLVESAGKECFEIVPVEEFSKSGGEVFAKAINKALVGAGEVNGIRGARVTDTRELEIVVNGITYRDSIKRILRRMVSDGKQSSDGIGSLAKARLFLIEKAGVDANVLQGMPIRKARSKSRFPEGDLLGASGERLARGLEDALRMSGKSITSADVTDRTPFRIRISNGEAYDELYDDNYAAILDRMRASQEFRSLGVEKSAQARDFLLKKLDKEAPRHIPEECLVSENGSFTAKKLYDLYIGLGKGAAVVSITIELAGVSYSDTFTALRDRIVENPAFKDFGFGPETRCLEVLATLAKPELLKEKRQGTGFSCDICAEEDTARPVDKKGRFRKTTFTTKPALKNHKTRLHKPQGREAVRLPQKLWAEEEFLPNVQQAIIGQLLASDKTRSISELSTEDEREVRINYGGTIYRTKFLVLLRSAVGNVEEVKTLVEARDYLSGEKTRKYLDSRLWNADGFLSTVRSAIVEQLMEGDRARPISELSTLDNREIVISHDGASIKLSINGMLQSIRRNVVGIKTFEEARDYLSGEKTRRFIEPNLLGQKEFLDAVRSAVVQQLLDGDGTRSASELYTAEKREIAVDYGGIVYRMSFGGLLQSIRRNVVGVETLEEARDYLSGEKVRLVLDSRLWTQEEFLNATRSAVMAQLLDGDESRSISELTTRDRREVTITYRGVASKLTFNSMLSAITGAVGSVKTFEEARDYLSGEKARKVLDSHLWKDEEFLSAARSAIIEQLLGGGKLGPISELPTSDKREVTISYNGIVYKLRFSSIIPSIVRGEVGVKTPAEARDYLSGEKTRLRLDSRLWNTAEFLNAARSAVMRQLLEDDNSKSISELSTEDKREVTIHYGETVFKIRFSTMLDSITHNVDEVKTLVGARDYLSNEKRRFRLDPKLWKEDGFRNAVRSAVVAQFLDADGSQSISGISTGDDREVAINYGGTVGRLRFNGILTSIMRGVEGVKTRVEAREWLANKVAKTAIRSSELLGPHGKEMVEALDQAYRRAGRERGIEGVKVTDTDNVEFECLGTGYRTNMRSLTVRMRHSGAFEEYGTTQSGMKSWLIGVMDATMLIRKGKLTLQEFLQRELHGDSCALAAIGDLRATGKYFTSADIMPGAEHVLDTLVKARTLFKYEGVYSFDQEQIRYLKEFKRIGRMGIDFVNRASNTNAFNEQNAYALSDVVSTELTAQAGDVTKKRVKNGGRSLTGTTSDLPASLKLAFGFPLSESNYSELAGAKTRIASMDILRRLSITAPVLDVGSGPVSPVAAVLGPDVVCSDINETHITVLSNSGVSKTPIVADMRLLHDKFGEGSFATVTSTYSLSQLKTRAEILQALTEMSYVGKEVVLILPQSAGKVITSFKYMFDLAGLSGDVCCARTKLKDGAIVVSYLVRLKRTAEPYYTRDVVKNLARYEVENRVDASNANATVHDWMVLNASPKEYAAAKSEVQARFSTARQLSSDGAADKRLALSLVGEHAKRARPLIGTLRLSSREVAQKASAIEQNGNFSVVGYKLPNRVGAVLDYRGFARNARDAVKSLKQTFAALGTQVKIRKYKRRGWYGVRITDTLLTAPDLQKDGDTAVRDAALRYLLRRAEMMALESRFKAGTK